MKYLFLVLLVSAINVYAEEKRHGPSAIEVRIETGTVNGDLVFVPDKLKFERGNYYKLVIHNPSKDEHYFSSDAFATHIFTRKVEVADASGKTIAEIHGDVHDMELKPGATVEWYFYPMTNGKHLRLYCHKDDHEMKGMTGEIEIYGEPPFKK